MAAFDGPGPIFCAHLLRRVDAKLLELLADLRPDEWDFPTAARQWKVRDVAAHLLDTVLRKLSVVRDQWIVEKPEIRSPTDLGDFVNRLNREGVSVYRRLSPSVLIALMTMACHESADFHESLDPFAPAMFAVSWAGEGQSPNWFDTARELTERWHHQQQIRSATDRPGIMTPELYHPVLDCFMRGLPHAYRQVAAPPGTAVLVEISGECGGAWQIERASDRWVLVHPDGTCQARILLPQEIAWLVLTRGLPRRESESQARIEGDRELALPVLSLTAIVA